MGEPRILPQVDGIRKGADQKVLIKDHLMFNISSQNAETLWCHGKEH